MAGVVVEEMEPRKTQQYPTKHNRFCERRFFRVFSGFSGSCQKAPERWTQGSPNRPEALFGAPICNGLFYSHHTGEKISTGGLPSAVLPP